ncbi:uncharacterized protein LOC122655479 [Telopea speciosissima]|uniref:uncharacterized protein LOC122655479 n=1 Tax=Telopea speciosissima TaxID=54955 RepID=UPI001CC6139D|nr:uncharacterized protein LOC122655479 [Telopea speciosissima]
MLAGASSPVVNGAPGPVSVNGNGQRSGGQRSWVNLFRGGKVREDAGSLPFFVPAVVNGRRVAFCPPEELEEEKDKWDAALIGYVFGPRPLFTAMQRFVKEKSGHVGGGEVFGLESGIFVFDFQGSDLSRQILDEGPWTLGIRPLILRPWSPEISLTKKEESELPLWVRLYGLNLHYWGERSLGQIASVLGRPICVDRRTSQRERLSFARLCVSIKASDGLPTTILLTQLYGSLVEQSVHYDWTPPLCSVCKVFGHIDNACPVAAINNTEGSGESQPEAMQVEDGWK